MYIIEICRFAYLYFVLLVLFIFQQHTSEFGCRAMLGNTAFSTLCAESREFIRLKRFDRFARQTRCFLLFTVSPYRPFRCTFLLHRFCVFPLPISHSTSFISRNQSCARRCNRISKFLDGDGPFASPTNE